MADEKWYMKHLVAISMDCGCVYCLLLAIWSMEFISSTSLTSKGFTNRIKVQYYYYKTSPKLNGLFYTHMNMKNTYEHTNICTYTAMHRALIENVDVLNVHPFSHFICEMRKQRKKNK